MSGDFLLNTVYYIVNKRNKNKIFFIKCFVFIEYLQLKGVKMQDKVCLDLSIGKDFAISQGMYFPLSILLSNSELKNWYYVNYMLPIARLDGANGLSCTMIDSYTYASEANINGKIMRYSNIDYEFCKQIHDIIILLCSEIEQRRYCILFLDYYHLKGAKTQYHEIHYVHEIMFYGYDNTRQVFQCLGYFNVSFERFELSYDEVKKAFADAIYYILQTDGWDAHMCMTLQLVKHKEIYPYDKSIFLDKLQKYIKGDILPTYYHEEALYLNATSETEVALGKDISALFLKYITLLKEALEQENGFQEVSPKYAAFHLYRDSRKALLERMIYFCEQDNKEKQYENLLKEYREVVEQSHIILMLYLKLFVFIQQENKLKANKTMDSIIIGLKKIEQIESKVLTQFVESV